MGKTSMVLCNSLWAVYIIREFGKELGSMLQLMVLGSIKLESPLKRLSLVSMLKPILW
jgi:hypothetical protein